MGFQLHVSAGPDKGKSVSLKEGDTWVVGRNRNAAVCLSDPGVSRAHCKVVLEGERVLVVDLQSTTGTWVDGVRAERVELEADDVFQVGETRIKLVDEEDLGSRAPYLPADRLHELSGTKLNRFEVGKLVAKAHSGHIFLARDTRLKRTVALKVFWPEFSRDKQEVKRFVRAMKTMMPLRHAHLVTIFGAGLTSPYCWIAMEFVEGESLTQWLQRADRAGRAQWQLALRVGVHVARALVFAHFNRIVHRNISPQNIMLRTDQVAKLGDLMMAKAMEGGSSQLVTNPGELVGDVYTMAPERTSAVPTELDNRSDIYSLGATMYALLTGGPPLKGRSFVETILKIRQEQPASPKTACPELPAVLEAAVMKMLAKRPEERFQSAAELLAALERIAKEQAVAV